MKQHSLLLINPWIYDFALYDFWARPLGILYLAGILRLNGYKISYIDCLDRYYPGLNEEPGLERGVSREYGTGSFYRQKIPKPSCLKDIPRYYYRFGLSRRLFLEALNRMERPEAVLVTSGMTYWYPGAFEVIRAIKQVWPDMPVILGGIYATICQEHAKTYSGADFVVEGPGEVKILPLLKEIIGGRYVLPLRKDAQGVLTGGIATSASCGLAKHAGTATSSPGGLARHVGTDEFPYPAFDLQSRIDYICLLTSRGCPFNCQYCASHLLQPEFFRRSPQRLVNEILFWNKAHGVKDFAFYDDALLIDADKHIVPILEAVIAEGIGVNFHTPNGLHARFIDAKLASLMYKAGFKAIRMGLETASDGRLDNKVTFEEFNQAVRCLKEAGFRNEQIVGYLLMGLPNQSPEEVESAVRMVQKCGAMAYLAEYSPIPGTALWKDAVLCSRYALPEDPLTHNNTVMPCLSKSFTWEHVRKLKELARSRTE